MTIQALNSFSDSNNAGIQPAFQSQPPQQLSAMPAEQGDRLYISKPVKQQKKSFYQKYKHILWGIVGAGLADVAGLVLLRKSFPKMMSKMSDLKESLITIPFALAGFWGGASLSENLHKKNS